MNKQELEWISVEDELPESGVNILIAYDNSYGHFSGMLVGRRVNSGFYSKASSYQLSGVTHWMPLPSPPKASEEGE